MDTKQQIIDSIDYVTSQLGWHLVSEDWVNVKHKCACAIGCVLVKNHSQDIDIVNMDNPSVEAAKLLGVTTAWINSFTDGFDGNGSAAMALIPEAWLMGFDISRETKPITWGQFFKKYLLP